MGRPSRLEWLRAWLAGLAFTLAGRLDSAYDVWLDDARRKSDGPWPDDGTLSTVGPRSPGIWVLFDGPPEHLSGRFIETEDEQGHGVGGFVWRNEGGYWALGPFARVAPTPASEDPIP